MLDLEPIKRREQHADKGPWYAHNPDDSYSMNIYCVTASEMEPDDEDDLEAAICVTLLQTGAKVGNRDLNWHTNAEFIANARQDIPALIAEVEQLRECNMELQTLHALLEMQIEKLTEELEWIRHDKTSHGN